MNQAEKAVRDYLLYLNGDETVGPDTSQLEADLAASKDPFERVKLRTRLSELSDAGPALEKAFVEHAATVVEKGEISVAALREEGVKPRVLREAGLTASRASSTRSSSSGPRVSQDEVAAKIVNLEPGTTFTLATLENEHGVGGSKAMISKVVANLVEEKKVSTLGEDPSFTGRGKPPTLYQLEG